MSYTAPQLRHGRWDPMSAEVCSACLQALDIAHDSFHQHGAEQQRWQALVGCNSLQCLVQHAMGDLNGASTSADVAQALADHTDQRRAGQGQQRDAEIPSALQRIGALRLAMVSLPCADHPFLDERRGCAQRQCPIASVAPKWGGQGCVLSV